MNYSGGNRRGFNASRAGYNGGQKNRGNLNGGQQNRGGFNASRGGYNQSGPNRFYATFGGFNAYGLPCYNVRQQNRGGFNASRGAFKGSQQNHAGFNAARGAFNASRGVAHITNKKNAPSKTCAQEFRNVRDKFGDVLKQFAAELEKVNNDHSKLPQTFIFCRTREQCDKLSMALEIQKFGVFPVGELRTEDLREQAFDEFRNEEITILTVTDLYSRCLDVKDVDLVVNFKHVDLVVNFELPDDLDTYIDRVGCAGRIGRGKAISYTCDSDKPLLKHIKKAMQNSGQVIPASLDACIGEADAPSSTNAEVQPPQNGVPAEQTKPEAPEVKVQPLPDAKPEVPSSTKVEVQPPQIVVPAEDAERDCKFEDEPSSMLFTTIAAIPSDPKNFLDIVRCHIIAISTASGYSSDLLTPENIIETLNNIHPGFLDACFKQLNYSTMEEMIERACWNLSSKNIIMEVAPSRFCYPVVPIIQQLGIDPMTALQNPMVKIYRVLINVKKEYQKPFFFGFYARWYKSLFLRRNTALTPTMLAKVFGLEEKKYTYFYEIYEENPYFYITSYEPLYIQIREWIRVEVIKASSVEYR